MSLISASFTQDGYARMFCDIANHNSSITTTSILYSRNKNERAILLTEPIPYTYTYKPKDPVQLSLFDENP